MAWISRRGASKRAACWALAALATGCSATSDPASGDLRLDLRHRDPRVRMEAAYLAAAGGRMDLACVLIENLRDRDESVRFITGIALKRMTGQDFGYLSYGESGAREQAIGRWRSWLEGTAEPASGMDSGGGPAPEQGLAGFSSLGAADSGPGPGEAPR